jgi:hypothetical protein
VDADTFAQIAPLMGVLYLVMSGVDVATMKRVRSFLEHLKRPTVMVVKCRDESQV